MQRTPFEIARKWREMKYWMSSMKQNTPESVLMVLKAALASVEGNEKQIALIEEIWQNLKMDPATRTEYDDVIFDSFEKIKVVKKAIKQR